MNIIVPASYRLRSCLGDDTMEWPMLATIEGPRKADGTLVGLSDEQAHAIIKWIQILPSKGRYIHPSVNVNLDTCMEPQSECDAMQQGGRGGEL